MTGRMLVTITLWALAAAAIGSTLNFVPQSSAVPYAEAGGFCPDEYTPARSKELEMRNVLSPYLIEHAESTSASGINPMISYGRFLGSNNSPRDSNSAGS